MDVLTTKAYLCQLKDMNRTIQRNLERLYELKESMGCLGGMDYKDKVQTTPNPDRIGSIVAKIVDLEKETDSLIDKYADISIDINIVIQNACTDNEERVLHKIYLQGQSISEIAESLKVTKSAVKKAHRKAIEKVAENIETQNIVF